MNVKTTTYNYTTERCTGTKTQPDTVVYFIKNKNRTKLVTYIAQSPQHLYGKLPIVSIFSGLARVISATKVIFRAIKSSNLGMLKNGFNNLFRGCVEIVPLTGPLLLIFDLFTTRQCIKKINRAIKDQNNILGVAIDGKVIYTLDIDKFKLSMDSFSQIPQQSNECEFASFIKLNNGLLEGAAKKIQANKNNALPMEELFAESGENLKK